jgi:hypothetical protein
MGYIVNNLSLNGQFQDLTSFGNAVRKIMEIRSSIVSFGHALYCHKQMLHCNATPDTPLSKAVNSLTLDERRAFVLWLTQHGPFWEEDRRHAPGDWLETSLGIVTDSAIGEAAFCSLHGIKRSLISFTPSDWNESPIVVNYVSDESDDQHVSVDNYWKKEQVDEVLQNTPVRLDSWQVLGEIVKTHCRKLTFSDETFTPLNGHPFNESAAERILFICTILNRLKSCFNEDGQRTSEGHEIYQNFFTGKKEGGGRGALFSDSSESEKDNFKSEMTFSIPGKKGKQMFCPWHGKVQTPQMRVHFSWPIQNDENMYIMYVGPKRTKR